MSHLSWLISYWGVFLFWQIGSTCKFSFAQWKQTFRKMSSRMRFFIDCMPICLWSNVRESTGCSFVDIATGDASKILTELTFLTALFKCLLISVLSDYTEEQRCQNAPLNTNSDNEPAADVGFWLNLIRPLVVDTALSCTAHWREDNYEMR